jgi:hypothetical protein
VGRYLAVLIGFIVGCAIIEGPCRLNRREVECAESGKIVLVVPAVTLEAAGSAAAQANPVPQFTDPMLIVPARQRR